MSWNVDITQGYGNCYLKTDPSGADSLNIGNDDGSVEHSAIVTPDLFAGIETDCEDGSRYSSPTGNEFELSCYTTQEGGRNSSSSHETSYADCADKCSTTSDPECAGVLFDMSLRDGFENCYLMTELGSPLSGANMTFAQMVTSNNTSDPGEGGSALEGGSGGPDAGLIAGPVVGAVVLLGLAGAGFWWWRRRRQCRNAQPRRQGSDHGAGYHAPDGAVPTKLPVEKDNDSLGPNARYELGDPNSEGFYQYEVNEGRVTK